MKTKTKTKKKPAVNKPTLIAFLLDRSGSMASCRDETISGFNGYVTELRKNKDDRDALFTLTQFDSQGIDLLHDAVPLKAVMTMTSATFEPRGSTPLYDAIGRTVRATEKIAGTKYKVLFVTLTDGHENDSHEWNLNSIRELIKEKEAAHWTFAHIGMGADGWMATQTYTAGTQSASNVLKAGAGKSKQAMATLARAANSYRSSAVSAKCSITNFYAGHTDGSEE